MMRTAAFGLEGRALLAVLHWPCDLAWCYMLSALSHKGIQRLGHRVQVVQVTLLTTSGVVLLLFGSRFLRDALCLLLGNSRWYHSTLELDPRCMVELNRKCCTMIMQPGKHTP